MRPELAERVALLENVNLFSRCSARQLHELAAIVREERVPSGTVLMRQGERSDRFVVLAEGLARVSIDGYDIGSIRPGSFAGELGLLDGGPRSATVTAVLPSRMLVLDAEGFESLLRRAPHLALTIMRGLAARIRAADATAATTAAA